jgi:2-hydroxymuconate-semialdehyde hydrolase
VEGDVPEPRQRWVDDLALSYEELQSIQQPVLLVHGYNDRVVPFKETSLRLMDLLPAARMHVFGRCGHWTMLEHTDAFNQLLVDFFAE